MSKPKTEPSFKTVEIKITEQVRGGKYLIQFVKGDGTLGRFHYVHPEDLDLQQRT